MKSKIWVLLVILIAGCESSTVVDKIDHIEAYKTPWNENGVEVHVIFKDKSGNNIFMTSETEYNLKIQFFQNGVEIYDFDNPWTGTIESGLPFSTDAERILVTVTIGEKKWTVEINE